MGKGGFVCGATGLSIIDTGVLVSVLIGNTLFCVPAGLLTTGSGLSFSFARDDASVLGETVPTGDAGCDPCGDPLLTLGFGIEDRVREFIGFFSSGFKCRLPAFGEGKGEPSERL